MRWSVLVCVAACASRVDHERAAPAPRRAISVPAVAAATVQPITGTHGSPIEIVAVTSEGDAAISADTRGAIRLWPTLDGTREPVVVHAGVPNELAIARDGDGFVVGNVDVAKGLELIRIDRAGHVQERVKTRGEAVQELVLIGRSVIVLRADQTIDVLDASGQPTARLVPDAGTRIVRLLAASTRVLAIGERGNKLFARWIDHGAGSWGATTSGFASDLALPMSVSPDGTYLVTNARGLASLTVLGTGKAGPAICDADKRVRSVALGFVDADTIACASEGRLTWWSMAAKKGTPGDIAEPIDERRDVVGREVVISRSGHDLVLRRRSGSKQLGYATTSNTVVRFSAGVITMAGVRRSLVLDASLRARASVEHPLDEGLLAIGDGYAIGISTSEVSVNDAWGTSHALSVFDLGRGITHQKLAVRSSHALAFEPVTGLLATIDGAQTHLLRYDPKTHTFGAPIAVAAEGAIHRIVLLDPALSSGLAALTVEDHGSSVTIGEIDARDLARANVKPRRTYLVEGALLEPDRAGRVYTLDSRGRVRVSKGSSAANELPILYANGIVPDRDGTRLVVLSNGEISLHLADGTHVWTIAARDVRNVRWVGDDLVASFADSLARIDLATGEIAARQCGWDFGLHEVKHVGGADTRNVCDAD